MGNLIHKEGFFSVSTHELQNKRLSLVVPLLIEFHISEHGNFRIELKEIKWMKGFNSVPGYFFPRIWIFKKAFARCSFYVSSLSV